MGDITKLSTLYINQLTDKNIPRVRDVIRGKPKIKCSCSDRVGQPFVSDQYYVGVLTRIREKIKDRKAHFSYGWLLQQDNEPAHTALSVKKFLTRSTSL